MIATSSEVSQQLPLTPLAFEILLAVGHTERHGYAIMRAVEERTRGRIALHPGTLYRAISRMVDQHLLAELEDRPAPDLDDGRRRAYFRLTEVGKLVAAAEAKRLESQVGAARLQNFLQEPEAAQ